MKPPTSDSKKTLVVFSAASFLNDLGADMVFSIWPVFVKVFLGLPASFLGFIDGLGEAINSLSQVFSGYFSDKLGRRKWFIAGGYLFSFLGRAGTALATGPLALLGARSLDRLGKLRDAPRDAYLAESVARARRGRSFGTLQFFDSLGAVFGILLSILLLPLLGFRNLILLAAIPTLASVILIVLFIREKSEDLEVFQGVHLKDFNPNLKLFFWSSAFLGLGLFSYSFVLLAAAEKGFGIQTLPLLYLIYTIFSSLGAPPFGRLADTIGRKWSLILGYTFWITLLAGFIFTRAELLVWFLMALYGVFKGSFETVAKTFVSELAPPFARASVLGGFKLILGLLAFPASVIAGVLWQRFGFLSPFIFSLVTTIISMLLLLKVKDTLGHNV